MTDKQKQVREFIESTDGRIFSVVFTKRSTGEERKMTCRTAPNAEYNFDPFEKGLYPVHEMKGADSGHKFINMDGVKEIRSKQKKLTFD